MTNPFDAAIIHLKIYAGMKPVREHEYFSVGYGDTPPVPVRQEDIHAAIRLLEAAGKVADKTLALCVFNDLFNENRVPDNLRISIGDQLRAIISALPDEVKP